MYRIIRLCDSILEALSILTVVALSILMDNECYTEE